MTTIKTGQSSNLGQIGPRAAELAALERIKKNPIDLLWEKCCGHSSEIIFLFFFLFLLLFLQITSTCIKT